MSKKTIIIILIICGVVLFGIYNQLLKTEEPSFEVMEVAQGSVFQEISETGKVKRGEEINLSFKNSGRIEKIYIEVGDITSSNNKLVQLDTNQLFIQLSEAEAALEISQAQLDKLLAGVTPEEIKTTETEVKNKETALDIAEENLEQAYEDALNILDGSYLKLYNAFNAVDSIQKDHFTGNDQESIKVQDKEATIENAESETKSSIETAENSSKNEDIEAALFEMEESLDKTSEALAVIRDVCDTPTYREKVSSSDKSSLDTHRTNINTALGDIIDSQQNISSMKLNVSTAEGDLQKAKDTLTELTAPPRKEDVNLYQAQIKEAQAKINLIGDQIREATLTSPIEGEVSDISKEVGEVVGANETIVSLIPQDPFQIEVDIYEEDIVKIDIASLADITLAALPNQTFKGKVISINPAEKVIDEVVYYETTIDFDEAPENIKPGMTADVYIKSLLRENVLIIPEQAIIEKDGKTIVEVAIGDAFEEREVQIGIEGDDEMVEVISGLKKREKIKIPR
jgi:RND family efflux transporter MFP subunit